MQVRMHGLGQVIEHVALLLLERGDGFELSDTGISGVNLAVTLSSTTSPVSSPLLTPQPTQKRERLPHCILAQRASVVRAACEQAEPSQRLLTIRSPGKP